MYRIQTTLVHTWYIQFIHVPRLLALTSKKIKIDMPCLVVYLSAPLGKRSKLTRCTAWFVQDF